MAWISIKKIGSDRYVDSNNFNPHGECIVDFMTAQSQYDVDTFSRAFDIPRDRFLITGLPRNDELAEYTQEKNNIIRNKLHVPVEKKIILYAPTYRNYEQDNFDNYIANNPIDFTKWKEKLGGEYIILFRAHYYVSKILIGNIDSQFVKDVSEYPSINDLLVVSDILVSDYSSVFFDYSITGKPIICFPYDLDDYREKVGLYVKLDEEMPSGIVKTEDELLDRIINLNYEDEFNETVKFRDKYIEEFGGATEKVVRFLFKAE